MPSRIAAPTLSSRPAGTRSPGSLVPPVPPRETKSCEPPKISAAPCGDDGAGHCLSRVDTNMHCVKLLGQRLIARDFDRHVAELQDRIAVLNGCTALGKPVTEAVGCILPRKGEPRPSPDLCNRAHVDRQTHSKCGSNIAIRPVANISIQGCDNALGDVLTFHGIFLPPAIRVRPNEGTDNEANEIYGRADHRHPGRA